MLIFYKKGTNESKLLDEKYDALKNMQLRMAKPKVETEQQVKKEVEQPIEQSVERVNVPIFVVSAQSHSTEYRFPNNVMKMAKAK